MVAVEAEVVVEELRRFVAAGHCREKYWSKEAEVGTQECELSEAEEVVGVESTRSLSQNSLEDIAGRG